jgi:hypothetical protein
MVTLIRLLALMRWDEIKTAPETGRKGFFIANMLRWTSFYVFDNKVMYSLWLTTNQPNNRIQTKRWQIREVKDQNYNKTYAICHFIKMSECPPVESCQMHVCMHTKFCIQRVSWVNWTPFQDQDQIIKWLSILPFTIPEAYNSFAIFRT